jgi:hypothetical protein
MNPNTGDESNYSTVTSESKMRKVSILADPSSKDKEGYDNHAFDNPSRKISQNSTHSENDSFPNPRKKSILHNPLTPEQVAQQLNNKPITLQPTINAPSFVPQLQVNG